jgi:two-component system cell cycle sensor histidine kinase/response regulator CckA
MDARLAAGAAGDGDAALAGAGEHEARQVRWDPVAASCGGPLLDEALRESEERYRILFENLNRAAFLVDISTGRIVETNRQGEVLLGRSRDQIVAMHYTELHPPARAAECAARFRERTGEERFGPAEFEVIRSDGTIVPVLLSDTCVELNGRRFALGLFQDLTEQKRAEQQLRAVVARNEALLAAVPDIIMETDADRIYTWANRAGLEFFGEDCIGREAGEYFEGDQATHEVAEPLFDGSSRDVLHVESWQRRRDGERRLLAWWCRALQDDEGNVVGALSTARDITEARRAEEALAASETRHRTLLDALPQKVFYKDVNGLYVYANRAYAEDLGTAPEDIVGASDHDLHPAELADKYRADDQAVMQSGQTRELEEGYVEAGRERIVHTAKTPVMDGNGAPIGVLGIFWDVTEQRRLEQQALQTSRLEAVGTLAGGIAHDFNNILTGIIGYADLLLADSALGLAGAAELKTIRDLGERAAGLTRQLLAFSRQQPFQPVHLAPNELIENLAKMLGRIIGEDVRLEIRLSPDVGTVRADRAQIEQVLVNLAANARDAMPGGGTLTVETANVTLEDALTDGECEMRAGAYVLIAISDTGRGMDEGTRARAFEPFFTTKEVGKGTGLGLASAYGIVKQHGGHIRVYSEPDHGTTVKVYLPCGCGEPRSTETEAVAEPDPRGCETILVVEDERTVLRTVNEALARRGFTVLPASSGAEAEALFDRHADEIDLLLLDVVMPGLMGPVLCEQLQARRPSVKVLYMSGYTEHAAAGKGVLDTGAPLLQKPFTPASLAQKVREVLDSPAGAPSPVARPA